MSGPRHAFWVLLSKWGTKKIPLPLMMSNTFASFHKVCIGYNRSWSLISYRIWNQCQIHLSNPKIGHEMLIFDQYNSWKWLLIIHRLLDINNGTPGSQMWGSCRVKCPVSTSERQKFHWTHCTNIDSNDLLYSWFNLQSVVSPEVATVAIGCKWEAANVASNTPLLIKK